MVLSGIITAIKSRRKTYNHPENLSHVSFLCSIGLHRTYVASIGSLSVLVRCRHCDFETIRPVR